MHYSYKTEVMNAPSKGDCDDFFPSTPSEGVEEEFRIDIKSTRHAIGIDTKEP
jgi:hypothetical protein